MKKAQVVVTIVTLYLLFFYTAPYIGLPGDIIFTMFFLSPFLVLSMVYVVLKYGIPSEHTFDERFYDDLDYKRNGKEEIN